MAEHSTLSMGFLDLSMENLEMTVFFFLFPSILKVLKARKIEHFSDARSEGVQRGGWIWSVMS